MESYLTCYCCKTYHKWEYFIQQHQYTKKHKKNMLIYYSNEPQPESIERIQGQSVCV